jgi:hypothetical protein
LKKRVLLAAEILRETSPFPTANNPACLAESIKRIESVEKTLALLCMPTIYLDGNAARLRRRCAYPLRAFSS